MDHGPIPAPVAAAPQRVGRLGAELRHRRAPVAGRRERRAEDGLR